jgi:hypothetical protein
MAGTIADEFSAIAKDANRTYYIDRFGADHRLACCALADWLEEAGADHPAALDALRTLPCRLAWSRTSQTVQITAPAHPKKTGRKSTVRYRIEVPQ